IRVFHVTGVQTCALPILAVVSTKIASAVHLVLDEVGLKADVVAGGLFAGDKGLALTEHGVSVYVGDHVGDVAGARAAGATSVARAEERRVGKGCGGGGVA